MKISVETVSIVGYGRFGKTLRRMLEGKFNIQIYDSSKEVRQSVDTDKKVKVVNSIKEVYQAEDSDDVRETKRFHAVFMAIPIEKFADVIKSHKKYFTQNHLIIDVLSVKEYPRKILSKALEGTDVQAILTHPMFGPDSSKNGFSGLPIVVDQFRADQDNYSLWLDYFDSIGLRVVELTPKQHDKMAANSQGVTHFLGRVLDDFGLEPTPIDTLGAKKLQEVMEQTCNDTWQLFHNLQNYNLYTKSMRIKLGNSYDKLYSRLLPSRRNPGKLVYGIQGGVGSFNEQALNFYIESYSDLTIDHEIKYLYTTEKVLKSLHRGEIDYGQFAIQNSVGGLVEESIRAMAGYKFEIIREFGIKIQHFMMKKPGVSSNKIDTIMTHPQVLKQCKKTLSNQFSHLELTSGEKELIDHAKVAKALKDDRLPDNIAVMGPKVLSDIYGLEIVAENLQDDNENFTSFLMVKRIE